MPNHWAYSLISATPPEQLSALPPVTGWLLQTVHVITLIIGLIVLIDLLL
jgi:hypothetical protein